MPNVTPLNTLADPYRNNNFDKTNHHATSYDIHLTITREDIGEILDYCLGQKISAQTDNTENLLEMAELIKTSKLSDEFCRHFTNELSAVLQHIIGPASDSYEIANLQHRMLRELSASALPASKRNAS